MSSQFDIFDNLNDYLNAKDDVDFEDAELEAEGGNLNGRDSDPDEIPPPIKQKRGQKAKHKTEQQLELSTSRKSKRLSAQAVAVLTSDEDEMDDDEGDGLSSGPSSSSLGASRSRSSVKSQPSQVSSVDLSGDDLNEQMRELQKQYNLIFNTPGFTTQDKRYFAGLKRQFQSLVRRQKSPRGKGPAFTKDFESLKETFYNICINCHLMAPPSQTANTERSSRRARRQQQLELINLVDSPPLILPGTINLDSDEEDVSSVANNKSANLSFDSENYEVSLKIKWEGKIERFSHRKFQKFGDLIAMLAERSGADPSHVVLDLDERIIDPNDTPDSIGYRISQFINGRVVRGELAEIFSKKKMATAAGGGKSKKLKDANEITLKVQSDRWKKPLEVAIRKENKMMILFIKCAEELKCQPGDIKLSFDGDPIALDSTPTDLELEGGEILDLRFAKG